MLGLVVGYYGVVQSLLSVALLLAGIKGTKDFPTHTHTFRPVLSVELSLFLQGIFSPHKGYSLDGYSSGVEKYIKTMIYILVGICWYLSILVFTIP